MKLDYKKTIYVGLAFFLISLFWQTYDSIITKILIDKFGLNQTWSGVVMAFDNVLALFLLPLFGSLSDKTHSKRGRRTPYIIIGTIVAAFAFVGLSFADNYQTNVIKTETGIVESYNQFLEERSVMLGGIVNKDDLTAHYVEYKKNEASIQASYDSGDITLDEYNTQIAENLAEHRQWESDFQTYILKWRQITDNVLLVEKNNELSSGYLSQSQYDRWYKNVYVNMDKAIQYATEHQRLTQAQYSYWADEIYDNVYDASLSQAAWEKTMSQPAVFIIFVVTLFIALVSMATFRSPAVALMPDVTIKPLRSKANAIINLMGTFGGILSILLLTVFALDKVSYVNYMPAFVSVSAFMLILLAIFLWKVKEPKLVEEKLAEDIKYDLVEVEEDKTHESYEALSKEKRISLYLILISVFLWFIGYNAVTTKLSDYAPKVLGMGFSLPLLIAQGAALIAFLPIGIIATKIGRRKTILIGITILTACFGSVYFITESTSFLMYFIFAMTGVGWATINVNSYPMVVELAKGSNVGQYTGYYYTFSMAAQILTPILSGILMDALGRKVLFPYAALFVGLAFVTMFFVKHGDAKIIKKESALENFDVDMD